MLNDAKENEIIRNIITSNKYGLKIEENGLLHQSNNNLIKYNNFLNNQYNAYDECNNDYENNYWDTWIGHKIKLFNFLPYWISGTFIKNFDWHPAIEEN